MARRPRIAILGFSLESNGFSPAATRADFEESYLLAGEALATDLRAEHPRGGGTLTGFVAGLALLRRPAPPPTRASGSMSR